VDGIKVLLTQEKKRTFGKAQSLCVVKLGMVGNGVCPRIVNAKNVLNRSLSMVAF
jgi:hypothetical protein|tara:strand:- start:217 stop:381 length:165 start_codon:yes stop_codon:yes gene_type:complete